VSHIPSTDQHPGGHGRPGAVVAGNVGPITRCAAGGMVCRLHEIVPRCALALDDFEVLEYAR